MTEEKKRIPIRLDEADLMTLEELVNKMSVKNKNAAIRRMIRTYSEKVKRIKDLEAENHAMRDQLGRCRSVLIHFRDAKQRQEALDTKIYQLVNAIS